MQKEKRRANIRSHYDDQTVENLKNYYMVGESNSSDLLKFIKKHGTHHDSDDDKKVS